MGDWGASALRGSAVGPAARGLIARPRRALLRRAVVPIRWKQWAMVGQEVDDITREPRGGEVLWVGGKTPHSAIEPTRQVVFVGRQ